ncbi:hypothetical protein [Rubellimicrobium aerolatum]|uniref:Uncharacterized protein n=1 Tax=Rubellimicrobium aerolatum TaxID=490979 RepID=A0ABW0SGT4_9RHOB|nr:hypothetical protein [Rubellimicrobium aerolatum]MBP1805822.1 fructoselysine-6-P-deglycase FrlB-like protein [Rubellimicrobium aerolatum]
MQAGPHMAREIAEAAPAFRAAALRPAPAVPPSWRAAYTVARGSSDAAALLLCLLYPVVHAAALALGHDPDAPETLSKVTRTR